MIDSVKDCAVSSLLGVDHKIVYVIPPYQREYTWSKSHWEDLIDDVLGAPEGYFLGSIICINQQKDATDIAQLELVDGQQRMTTLSIMLAALYSCLAARKDDLDEDENASLINLRRKLVLKDPADHPRLTPQRQNNNAGDYIAVLSESGVVKQLRSRPGNLGNRRIMKCYRYFVDQIEARISPAEPSHTQLLRMVEQVSAAVLVKIEVKNHSDAYVLFESLNNRGAQLTPIDLIKNKLLASTHGKDALAVEAVFEEWMGIIDLLGDDYSLQERFFRQYYNAFKEVLNEVVNEPVATRSNLIRIYEKLIEHGHEEFVSRISAAAEVYSQIAGGSRSSENPALNAALIRLRRAQGAPSHLLLMYLMTNQGRLNLTDGDLVAICDLLVAFFVRRNVTGLPATYELQRLFMAITHQLHHGVGEPIFEMLRERLVGISSSDELFREKLAGNAYEDSYDMTRFILCSLAEASMTDETRVDLWAMEGKRHAWSVEHIFPQGANIPASWVDMLGGSPEVAKAVQAEHVHTLGNLSITRFNATLSNKSFLDKLDARDSNGNSVGLKNMLRINDDVISESTWTKQHIIRRSQRLVDAAFNYFRLK
ncbi:UNVERIFIED_ORG: hypothetical protein ABIB52_002703 [Arthrobacter sp. UYCu721]